MIQHTEEQAMWSAFPSRSRVKLWIDQDDRLMTLDLLGTICIR